jgi:DNA-binding CsgD family transcriptional regulator
MFRRESTTTYIGTMTAPYAVPHPESGRLLGRRAECDVLEGLLADAVGGRSRAMVLRGEPGVGKSALLAYLCDRLTGWHVARAVGVESEMELAFSGLHQLCAAMMDHLDRLPVPQRDALTTAFGVRVGPAPDRFLVGLATLTLFAEVADGQPLACVVDDAQWLDHASAQILGFVARRLVAEPIAVVCAARAGEGDDAIAGLPELVIDGLNDNDALALLLDNVHAPLDAAVCDQIIAESHGNPLALLELPRTWKGGDLAGGFGVPGSPAVVGKIEQSYAHRLMALPPDTKLLVLAAAAEPLGDFTLLHRATQTLGVEMSVAGPAVDAGLLKIGGRVEFSHPLVRSAVYRSARANDRHRVHRALAEATDAAMDPDRRAWHRARATPGPDENIAVELVESAGRAQARGGVAASAAFLERAAELTPEPHRRAQRQLAAADAKRLAGLPAAASALITTAMRGPLDALDRAQAQRLKGRIALDVGHGADAAALLLVAAQQLEALDVALARQTHLESLWAASYTDRFDGLLLQAAEAARAAPSAPAPPTPTDLLLDGRASRVVEGYSTGAPILKRALAGFREAIGPDVRDDLGTRIAARVAAALFDDETWNVLASRHVQVARETGLLSALPATLGYLATLRIHEGRLEAAARLLDESDAISTATGSPPNATRMLLAAFRGNEAAASRVIETVEVDATAHGDPVSLGACAYARIVLCNGLGYYATALVVAQQAIASDPLTFSSWLLPELIEAAVRSDRRGIAVDAHAQLLSRAQAMGTDFARGIEACSRAVVTEGAAAEQAYRDAIDLLGRTRMRLSLARAHLLFGEWLRRENRRLDSREELRAAYAMFTDFGTDAFAERSRRELLATGEKVRKRRDETRHQLTSQEEQIARLARDGLSNPDIGAQLFISARTVEWHLRKVFTKLGINSRKGLRTALPRADRESTPA